MSDSAGFPSKGALPQGLVVSGYRRDSYSGSISLGSVQAALEEVLLSNLQAAWGALVNENSRIRSLDLYGCRDIYIYIEAQLCCFI